MLIIATVLPELEGITLDSLRTAGVLHVQRALAPRALLLATDRVPQRAKRYW